MTTAAELVARQDRLIRVLACPTCGDRLEVHGASRHDGMVVEADLLCAVHGLVGIIESYDVSFRPVDLERARGPLGRWEHTCGVRSRSMISG